MKLIWVILLVWSTTLFGQKPAIKQENYNWNQSFDATISDKGTFVLTQSNTGLYVYHTSTGHSVYYANAFNGKISSNEKLVVFQQPNDTLGILNTKDNRVRYLDSVSNFQFLNTTGSILIQKVNGSLYAYFSSLPITMDAVDKYIVDKSGSKVYYSDKHGLYIFQNNRVDTIFKDGSIVDFKVDDLRKEVVVQLVNDIIVIKEDRIPISISQLLDPHLEIIDQGIQLEQPTGKIYFKAAAKKITKEVAASEKYSGMQVWNYKDPYLYPILVQKEVDSSHYCVFDPARNSILDFGNNQFNYYPINAAIENKFIIGLTPINVYEKHWQKSGRASCFLINTNNGNVKEIYHEMDGYSSMPFQLQLDPTQKFLLYYDLGIRKYRVYNIISGTETVLGRDTKLIFDNIDEDPSFTPSPYGIAGWSENGRFVYVYDKYDIWKLDLEGMDVPRCVTQQVGVRANRKFRLVNGGQEVYIREDEELLLACFDYSSRDNGYYELNIKKGSVRELIMDAHLYFNPGGSSQGKQPLRSLNKKYWLFQRMSAGEYPNYFITEKFKKIMPVTHFEPQADYNWMRTKLVKMGDVEGILYLPENFDAGKKYPIIFYLYERFTDGLNQYQFPQLSEGQLNIPWYVSNDYLVFAPDVKYRSNEPGESALRTVKISRDYFVKQSYIDSLSMGVQGHSFGGYEVNYIVTHYGGFAAACAVSGASNLFTSFGSLRAGGNSGQTNFERGQYRIRRPIWEIPEVFLNNSPISNTDKVTTPLLLVSNKRDSTVSWSHAVEMFTALRRQGKVCWLLQYDHSKHAISNEDALDFSIRMQQYFDYYLKHQRQADWMKVETRVRDRSRFPLN